MGILNSFLFWLKKEKTITTKHPGELESYKDFALKNLSELTIRGPLCEKDLSKIASISKEYRSLKKLDLKNTLEVYEISNNMFHACDNLECVILPDGVIRIGESAFESCRKLKDLELPDSLVTISKSAFYGCSSLRNIFIPKNVKNIGNWAFTCKNLDSIQVADNNIHYKSTDGILFSANGETLIKYPCNKQCEKYVVPEGITNIANAAFQDCVDLQEVQLPSSIVFIGDNAFFNTSLKSIKFPENTKSIGKLAFSHCAKLEEVNIPGSVNHLGERAFTECHKLYSVAIGDGITGIEDNVFANCSSLKNVDLPASAYLVKE